MEAKLKTNEPVAVGVMEGGHKIYVGTKAIKPPKSTHTQSPNYPSNETNSGIKRWVSLHFVVDQLAPSGSGWIHTTLYSFTNMTGGAFPQGVILDPTGDLFGVTPVGGSNNTGTAFELTPGSGGWTFNAFFNFTGLARCGPDAPLTIDNQGNLYGVTQCDGYFEKGSVFKLTPAVGGGWNYSDLHDFDGGPDGGYPAAAVALDASGNIYGTTSQGGNNSACDRGCGVVWEITP